MPEDKDKTSGIPTSVTGGKRGVEARSSRVKQEKEKGGGEDEEKKSWLAFIEELLSDKWKGRKELEKKLEDLEEKAAGIQERVAEAKKKEAARTKEEKEGGAWRGRVSAVSKAELKGLYGEFEGIQEELEDLKGLQRLVSENLGDEEKEGWIDRGFKAEKDKELARELVEIAQKVHKGELTGNDKARLEEVAKAKNVNRDDFFVENEEEIKGPYKRILGREWGVRMKLRAAAEYEEMENLRIELEVGGVPTGYGGRGERFLTAELGDVEMSFFNRTAPREYRALKRLVLTPEWSRLITAIERDIDPTGSGWYRNLREISWLANGMMADRGFKSALKGIASEETRRGVTRFLERAKRYANHYERDYVTDSRRNFNWLAGEWTRAEIFDFFKDIMASDVQADVLAREIEELGGMVQGRVANSRAAYLAEDIKQRLNVFDEVKLDDQLRGLPPERVSWVAEFHEGLYSQVEEIIKEGKIPKNMWLRRKEVEQQQAAAAAAVRGGRREAHVPMDIYAPPDGGEATPGGISPFAHPEFKRRIEEKQKQEGVRGAIEWLFNLMLEKDLDERDQYYLLQNIKDMMAGAEGKLDPDPDKDLLIRAVYQEFLGQLGLFRQLPGVQSEDHLFGILSRISVGDMEDLMVFKKDFEDWGGVAEVRIRDTGDRARDVITARRSPELKAFEIGGADVEALLETQHWFNEFQFKTRGSPANSLRKRIFMEAVFRKMGGEVELTKKADGTFESTYYIRDGAGVKVKLEEKDLKNISFKFGEHPRAKDKTLGELADENLWVAVIGEMNWEFTGKRPEMNKFIEGRRTIYRWDKHFHYDVYMSKLGGARGMDFLYTGYKDPEGVGGKLGTRKPYLNTMQPEYVSYRAKSVLMPYLLNPKDLRRPGKDGKSEVLLVRGAASLLQEGKRDEDDRLAEGITSLLTERMFNSRGNMRDLEVIRALFDEDKMPDWVKEGARGKLVFSSKERELLAKGKWDQLLAYLCDRTGGTKLSQRELKYVVGLMGARVNWKDREHGKVETVMRGGAERFLIEFYDPGDRRWKSGRDFREDNEAAFERAQLKGAKYFFETLSRQRLFWEVDEQDRFQKEANYMKQTAAQAPKMAAYAANPTADNMIEWLAPNFGFRRGDLVRETAYRNADAVLDARSRWSFRMSMAAAGRESSIVEHEGELDADGYVVPKRRARFEVAGAITHPKKTLKGAWESIKRPKKLVNEVVGGWRDFSKSVRIFFKGKTGVRGWEPLDAWGKKNYIDKLWHSGMIDWWQKEKLMAAHVAPAIPVPIIGPAIKGLVIKGLDSERFVPKAIALTLGYIPSLITRPAYLHLWIHDWGKASESFWNEVVAPGLAGEHAKALQVPSG